MAQRMRDDQARRRQSQAAQNQAEGDQNGRQHLGRMIANGDCPGALKATLDAGRLDMAREVQALCAAGVR